MQQGDLEGAGLVTPCGGAGGKREGSQRGFASWLDGKASGWHAMHDPGGCVHGLDSV